MTGETNTDDLSPAPDAWSRLDIPLHALAMLKNARPGITPDKDGVIGPIKTIDSLKEQGFPLAYVGDVVGTGSSQNPPPTPCSGSWATTFRLCRTSVPAASASVARLPHLLQHHGRCRRPAHRSGRLQLEMGDVIDIFPYEGKITRHGTDEVLAQF